MGGNRLRQFRPALLSPFVAWAWASSGAELNTETWAGLSAAHLITVADRQFICDFDVPEQVLYVDWIFEVDAKRIFRRPLAVEVHARSIDAPAAREHYQERESSARYYAGRSYRPPGDSRSHQYANDKRRRDDLARSGSLSRHWATARELSTITAGTVTKCRLALMLTTGAELSPTIVHLLDSLRVGETLMHPA